VNLDEIKRLQEECDAKSKEVRQFLTTGTLPFVELINVMKKISDLQKKHTQTLIDGVTFLDNQTVPDAKWWQRQHDHLIEEIDYYNSLLGYSTKAKITLNEKQQKLLNAIIDSGFKNPGLEGLFEIYEALS